MDCRRDMGYRYCFDFVSQHGPILRHATCQRLKCIEKRHEEG